MNTSTATVIAKKTFLEESFDKILSKVTHVPYNPEWKHGDYFNGACAEQLKPGEIVASAVEGRDARRMLLIGTRAGTVVVFERYTPNNGSAFVLVSNTCMELRSLVLPSGSMDEDTLMRIVSPHKPEDNVGSRMEAIFNMTAFSQRIS